MTAYRYVGRYWCELLAAGSLVFITAVIAAPIWF
jgi:hypothetical protein